MTTYEQLKGAVALASNTPGMPTGYGNQGKLLAERLVRHGIEFAALSNYGIEGKKGKLDIGGKEVLHYPRGLTTYGIDVIPIYTNEFAAMHPDLKTVLFTLYDVWVYNQMKYEGPIVSWVPLDHVTPPPAVVEFLKRENVKPVTMAPHGQRQLGALGIESTYIPHAIDTKVYKPTHKIGKLDTRDYMGIDKGAFVVGIVAANKANGSIHRKAFAENLLAFSIFKKKYPDAQIYIHTEPSQAYGGFFLPNILKAVGLSSDSVLLPDSNKFRDGYTEEEMAAFYTTFDVLLSTSYGEGFGIPTVEAQACGTRVITSNYAASADLASPDSWLIDGQAFWDEAQASFFMIPSVNKIVIALEEAYKAERGVSDEAVKFASQFDVEYVWENHWMPFLRDLFK